MFRALLIEFDPKSGRRAGGINPRDPKLPCYGWQVLDSTPAREIRLVQDDRNLSQYQGVPGITILEGEHEINTAIESLVPEQYKLENQALMTEHLRQKQINLDEYAGRTQNDVLKDLYDKGIAGIVKRPIARVEE